MILKFNSTFHGRLSPGRRTHPHEALLELLTQWEARPSAPRASHTCRAGDQGKVTSGDLGFPEQPLPAVLSPGKWPKRRRSRPSPGVVAQRHGARPRGVSSWPWGTTPEPAESGSLQAVGRGPPTADPGQAPHEGENWETSLLSLSLSGTRATPA